MKPELREDIEIHKTNAGFEVRVVALEFELLRTVLLRFLSDAGELITAPWSASGACGVLGKIS